MCHNEEGHSRVSGLATRPSRLILQHDMIYYIQCSCLSAAQSSYTKKWKTKITTTQLKMFEVSLQFCVGPHSQLSLTICGPWAMGRTDLKILLEPAVHSARNRRKISQSGQLSLKLFTLKDLGRGVCHWDMSNSSESQWGAKERR